MENLMAILDEQKTKMSDNAYLQLCNALMDAKKDKDYNTYKCLAYKLKDDDTDNIIEFDTYIMLQIKNKKLSRHNFDKCPFELSNTTITDKNGIIEFLYRNDYNVIVIKRI